jgi:hypothetical protein
MRDCPNVEMRDRLPELLHGRLTAAATEELSAHLGTCEACSEELTLLRALRDALPVGAAIDVSAVVAVLPRRPARRVGARLARWGSVAGLALAAGLAAVMVLDRGPETATDPGPAGRTSAAVRVAPETVSSPRAQARAPRPSATERELALGAGLADVDDRELAKLISDVERLEAVPIAEPEEYLPVAAGGASGGDSW